MTPEHTPANAAVAGFGSLLLDWHQHHGRHDLPWQSRSSVYTVWVAEIMLQQTQVNTVIPYYLRFLGRFPNVLSLANAPEDEVLHLWTGLGYYARARNLHRSAQLVRDHHAGEFPDSMTGLCELPGIGRSTAAAIAAACFGQPAAILDGNVKRVLSRVFAVDGDPRRAATLKLLWNLAEELTPALRTADYNQAIMDLGATVCVRSRPGCGVCPLRGICLAYAEGSPTLYPTKKAARSLPERRRQLLIIRNRHGEVCLEKRPPQGIWGGLWSFPEIAEREDAFTACDRLLGAAPVAVRTDPVFRHTFSHYHLLAIPVHIEFAGDADRAMEGGRLIWYKPGQQQLGLAAPVKRLLQSLSDQEHSIMGAEPQ